MVVFVVRRVVGFSVRRLEDLTDELLAGAEARVPKNAVIHESPVLMALAISDNAEAESRRPRRRDRRVARITARRPHLHATTDRAGAVSGQRHDGEKWSKTCRCSVATSPSKPWLLA